MENIEKYEDWQDSRISVKTRFEEQEEQAETRTPGKRKFEDIVEEDPGQNTPNPKRQEIQNGSIFKKNTPKNLKKMKRR